MRKALLTLVIVLMMGLFAACGSAQHDEALVGTWRFDDNIAWYYEFNSDGTGLREHPDVHSFTWSTNDNNRLTLNFGAGYSNDNWNYIIQGSNLTITRRDGDREMYSYFIPENDEALLGFWTYENIAGWKYEFNSDGTGRRGQHLETQSFNWLTSDGTRLVLDMGEGYYDNNMDYVIVGNTLTVTHREGDRATYNYFRIEHSSDIVGTWEWDFDGIDPLEFLEYIGIHDYDGDVKYTLSFSADGTAISEFLGEVFTFEWFNTDDRLIFDAGTVDEEVWNFVINNDILTIESRQVAGLIENYVKVG